ncbi:MAG: YceD family protein [Thiobacillaceae bacterium]|jgi:uncharacterized protein
MLMFQRLSVNPVHFAAAKQIWQGSEPIGSFERLAQETLDPGALLHYRIEGGKDKMGRVRLLCKLEGHMEIACQRCLGPVEHTIEVDKFFYPVESSERLEQIERELALEADPSVETIEAGHMLDLAALIEDEVLLGLPVIPMHPAGACHPPVEQVLVKE